MIDDYKREILEKLIAVYERRYHHNSDFGQKISLKFGEKNYEK